MSEGCKAKSKGRQRLWSYLAVKKLSALLRGITSKHHSDFCCLNCLHSFTTEKRLNCIKKYGCKSVPENSSATKISKPILSAFLVSTISVFRSIENRHDAYRGKGCMKTFCGFLREHTIKISNSKKKKNQIINKRPAGII